MEDEYRALEGSHKRQVRLDERGMFPGHAGALTVRGELHRLADDVCISVRRVAVVRPNPEVGPTMAAVHLHHDDVPDTLALLGALLGQRSKLPAGYILSTTGADVHWELLAESWLSTTEKAVVHIAHGCAILERHGGGLPSELRSQVRAAVDSTTE